MKSPRLPGLHQRFRRPATEGGDRLGAAPAQAAMRLTISNIARPPR
jgi:hypothetical protein